MQTEILFSEIQKMGDYSIVILLCVINILFIYLLAKGFKTKSRVYLLATTVGFIIAISTTLLTLNLKLYTEIRKDGVYVKLFPLQLKFKHYNWMDISKAYVRTYQPVADYGGWGLKGSEHNAAINVSGNIGLQLVFKNEDKLLIGTNQPKELTQALNKLEKYKN
ncbi:DUF6141 family protein [Pedobacter nototheniae]|uniref:DUF6141 family protein n=1 Tax=Pedobacter nototheniae TaxID=2488994 RepID=UPI00103DC5CB|nr:DUF6141 family protein [Pedobacter nototheniae]